MSLNFRPSAFLLLLLVATGLCFADSVTSHERTVTKLAEGIYEIRHPDAPDGFPQGNSTVVIGDRGVLVVDSCLLPASAREDIAQIKQWTNKPVLFLVNTHFHIDHTLGNATYAAAFPSIQIIAQKETRKLIAEANPGGLARYPQRGERTRKALESGKKSDGTPLTEGERKRYELRLAGLKPTLEQLQSTTQLVPNVSFDHELDLDLGHRSVSIRFLGRGNTSGDTVIYLPAEKILAAGDLLDHPVPYFFGDLSVDHAKTLQQMAALEVDTIIPGHGDVLHGKDYILQVIDLLNAVNTEVENEINGGASTPEEVEEKVPKVIDQAKWREKFAGNDPVNGNFFDVSFGGLIEAAFQQIRFR